MAFDAQAKFKELKENFSKEVKGKLYNEDVHCPMIIDRMNNKGTYSSFCLEVGIAESTFFRWVQIHPMFGFCYYYGKMVARQNWEEEGEALRDHVYEKGESGHSFEYWRMVGWSRFGVGKNQRIRLELTAGATPMVHYKEIMEQAARGDYTAGEIKQLMEAVNIGFTAHQVCVLQEQIDALTTDLAKMDNNRNAQSSITNKPTAQKDTHSVADNLC